MAKQTKTSNFNQYTIEELDKVLTELTSKPTKKYYLAAPWFSDKMMRLYQHVVNILDKLEVACYIPSLNSFPSPFETFLANVNRIKQCDTVLALIDEKDVGTAWEIGMATELGKEIILVGLDETSFLSHTNIMLAFCGKCLLLKDLEAFLKGQSVKYVYIDKDSWEGKE